MRIAICDDMTQDAKQLEEIVRQRYVSVAIKIDIFNDGRELLDYMRREHGYFDIVLLDIDMPGINGLELGKHIKKIYPNVILIFATGYPQYMLDAFDLEAFHYILKPFDASKILSIIERARQKYLMKNKYHCIKIKNQMLRLNIKEIFYIEYCQKHVIYYTKNKNYETVDTLGRVYNSLKDYGFYQIHQGYIVNFEKVDHFEGYSVVLTDGRKVAISVRKKSEVLLAYSKFIREKSNA